MRRLRSLSEAECYARCYGGWDVTVHVLRLQPRVPRHVLVVEGEADRLGRLAETLNPAWIGFVGKEAYRGTFGERPQLGEQQRRLSETRLFVLPSTSPANAAVPWDERLRWFRALAGASAASSR